MISALLGIFPLHHYIARNTAQVQVDYLTLAMLPGHHLMITEAVCWSEFYHHNNANENSAEQF